ncbi:hypothetical protein AGMMS49959_11020 [Planctomycetales bacterium]|nr:hypothetical protein AGMMS49959_11020 [Planctomycetales bacterium]
MLTLSLPQEMDSRLASLASNAGRTKSDFVVDALSAYFEEISDAELAETALSRFYTANEKAIPLTEMERRLGLAMPSLTMDRV